MIKGFGDLYAQHQQNLPKYQITIQEGRKKERSGREEPQRL
jgi:hypothetical protein